MEIKLERITEVVLNRTPPQVPDIVQLSPYKDYYLLNEVVNQQLQADLKSAQEQLNSILKEYEGKAEEDHAHFNGRIKELKAEISQLKADKQKIIQELEEPCPHEHIRLPNPYRRECLHCWQAIKSKYGG
jgi:chromosome segregation ATPase